MTPQQIKAMKLALEALEKYCTPYLDGTHPADDSITAIKEALAKPEQIPPSAYSNTHQPEQEPVAWMDADGNVSDNNDHNCFPIPLYTTPPQRKPLTDKAITQVIDRMPKKMKGFMVDWDLYIFARAIEAAHGIKEST